MKLNNKYWHSPSKINTICVYMERGDISGGTKSGGFVLINVTKKEKITYLHLPVSTKREIAGNPVSSAITT